MNTKQYAVLFISLIAVRVMMLQLDQEQTQAATETANAVISAGAGSGKTRVLAARYLWLITQGKCNVEEILTITFTNKAANEMYRRIYSLLAQYAPENEYAKAAVKDFYKANICTLDSFCMSVARTLSRRYGISPDFESDEVKVKELASDLALRFVLDKRDNEALQQIIAHNKMRFVAENLFVKPILYHSPISSPLDFKHFEQIQKNEIQTQWKQYTGKADDTIALIKEQQSNVKPGTTLAEHLAKTLNNTIHAPDINTLFNNDNARQDAIAYIACLKTITSFTFRGRQTETAQLIKEAVYELRDIIDVLKALANYIAQWDIVCDVFPLIDEYQTRLNNKKRTTGVLTFTDIAHLAVDGLKTFPEIRRMYRDSFKMIMIDEFQDNNSLQRDLVNLLLDPAKAFYVGDEKQSIYRFRGADVSVFRSLANEAESNLSLNYNYRSHPALIDAFNHIFDKVFASNDADAQAYEAVYREIKSGRKEQAEKDQNDEFKDELKNDEFNPAKLHFAFFNKDNLIDNPNDGYLQADDYEARFIAHKIKTMVSTGHTIQSKDGERVCTYEDFAVLQRSRTHQSALEKALKQFDVPFSADQSAAMFSDAPVNDIRSFLKIIVYPEDRITYGAVLRSPFVRLSEDGFNLCMLQGKGVFDDSLDDKLCDADRIRYQNARRLYLELRSCARELPVSALISKLWYDQGYRYEALWPASSQVYLSLYDLFFEQAQLIEQRGKGLVDFLDYIEDLANKEEKPDDSAMPDEEGGGVRLMTIHGSKGLEFPIVFVYNCGSIEKSDLKCDLAFYSERWGIVLKLPTAEGLEAGNYFYLAEQQEHKAKSHAELKRLLYVAMTRAEEALYVTAVIPGQNKAERAALNPDDYLDNQNEFIARRHEQYKFKPNAVSISFLRLLPVLSTDNPLYTIEAIGEYSPQKTAKQTKAHNITISEYAKQVYNDYQTIPVVPPYKVLPLSFNASNVHTMLSATMPIAGQSGAALLQEELRFDEDATDALLEQSGLEAKDFGTIVHSFIEDKLNGRPYTIPRIYLNIIKDAKQREQLMQEAALMADGFFNSPLGKQAAEAAFIKTEYPIITVVNRRNANAVNSTDKVSITGKIDLLFDNGSTMRIVDFKTDKEQDISRHVGQLAVYKRAVEDIFKKPAECLLFYLRDSKEVDITDEVSKVVLEEAVTIPTMPR